MVAEEGAPVVIEKKQVPIKEGFFAGSLTPFENVRLKGLRCLSCGEVFLGKRFACENCQNTKMEDIVLGRKGKLYSYTVIRARPRPPYVGPDPFVPFAVGWVELPEGLRILSVLTDCDVDAIEIDMDVELVVGKLCEDEEGNEMIAFKFKPVQVRR